MSKQELPLDLFGLPWIANLGERGNCGGMSNTEFDNLTRLDLTENLMIAWHQQFVIELGDPQSALPT